MNITPERLFLYFFILVLFGLTLLGLALIFAQNVVESLAAVSAILSPIMGAAVLLIQFRLRQEVKEQHKQTNSILDDYVLTKENAARSEGVDAGRSAERANPMVPSTPSNELMDSEIRGAHAEGVLEGRETERAEPLIEVPVEVVGQVEIQASKREKEPEED